MAGFASLSFRQKTALVCIGLTILVVSAFWQVARCDFLIYDDWEYVVTNDMVRRGLTAESISWAFQKFHSSNWHPLTWLSHMVDVQLYGLRPLGHHVTNLILHTANTLLLFSLLRRLTGSLWRSAIVAALFGLHPTHVESVAWVAERKDVLSTFFGLLSLLAYSRYAGPSTLNPESRRNQMKADQPSTGFAFLHSPAYWLTGLFLALGLMSKPMLVTWPFVMLLLDVWPLNRVSPPSSIFHLPSSKWWLLEKIPFLTLAVASSVLTFLAQRSGGAVQSLEQLSLGVRVGNAVVSYVRYLGKTFWPVDLSIYYPYPTAWSGLAIVGAALLLGALLAIAVRYRQPRPFLLFGFCWFLGTLVPVIGVVQVGGQSIADRYTYIPQIGIFIIMVWFSGELVQARKRWRIPAGLLVGLSLLLCFGLTRNRVADWRDSEALFTQAIRVTKNNHIAHNNLGLHYLKQNKHNAAIRCFSEALRIRPGFAATHNNLALSLSAIGQLDAAVEQCRTALRSKPALYEARVNLGNLLVLQGNLTEAVALLQEAVGAVPNYPDGQLSLANALVEQDRLDEALGHLRLALQLRPDYAEAMNCFGSILLRQGKTSEAVAQYRAALAVNPQLAEPHSNLGLALAGMGHVNEAIASYETALQLNPELLSAHFGLAILLEDAGKLEAATAHWAAAVEKSPSLAGAREQMGMILAKQGKLAEALLHLAEAVRLLPGNARLRAQHGLVLDQMGQTQLALTEYRQAIALNPNQPEVLNNLAWILAANAVPELRNAEEAIRFGESACRLTGNREARFVGTLAAAYAAAGRFAEAEATAQRAIELARAAGQGDLAARNTELLELYRAGKPYYEPPLPADK